MLSPSGVDSPSNLRRHNFPRQVLKFIPSRFWKLVPYKVRTSLPSFIQSYSSQGLINGLSSANRHGRSPPTKFFQSPAEFIFQIPNGFYLSNPQQSLSSLSPAKSIIKVLSRPLVKLRPSISSTEQFLGRSSRIYFPKTKLHS